MAIERKIEKLRKLRREGEHIKNQFEERTLGYILAALGLVAGFSWNETIKAFIEYLFPIKKETLLAKFTYSILITVLVVVLTVYLGRVFSKEGKK